MNKPKQQTSKFQQWKIAMKNTPPERLLKINMQGFVMYQYSNKLNNTKDFKKNGKE